MLNPFGGQSRTRILNYIFILVISIIGIYRQNFTLQRVTIFEQVMIQLLAPLQSGTSTAKRSFSHFVENYLNLVDTSRQNQVLKKQVAELTDQVFKLEGIRLENTRLKALLQFGKEIPKEKVLAQVIAWDSNNEFKVLRINKGQKEGIQLRAPVITSSGLVGYVVRVFKGYADVLTILDQNNRVDAIIRRTRSHGIVEGTSNLKCRMKYIVRTSPVEENDTVVTAGLGNIYPKGIKVGTITKINKQSFGLTQSIEITPSVDFMRLEEVVVLLPLENPMSEVTEKSVEELLQEGNTEIAP